MERRKYTREFKLEAVKLIQERGVSVAQTSQLRKDKPHPVGPLLPVSQRVDNLAIGLGLGIHKADEIGFRH